MQAGITGATLLGNAVIFDGRIYLGMALPGSSTVGIDLNIDRLQYGMDGQGNLSFQGVTADGSFTPGTEMSKKLLGGFGINGSAEGSIDTFNGKYSVAFDIDAKLANFASSMSLRKRRDRPVHSRLDQDRRRPGQRNPGNADDADRETDENRRRRLGPGGHDQRQL